MTSYLEHLAEDRRRAVLLILSVADGFSLNEETLARELARLRYGVITRDDLRGVLAWLERQGLVSIERLAGAPGADGLLWAATATRAGRDVARGAAHPGIAAPL